MQDVFEPMANFGGEVFEPMNFDGDYSEFAVLNCGCKVAHPFNKGRRDACINECNKKKDAKKGVASVTDVPLPTSESETRPVGTSVTPPATPLATPPATPPVTATAPALETTPDAPAKQEKFLGMPKKIGIGVTIGVGVLAIGLTTFFLLRRK